MTINFKGWTKVLTGALIAVVITVAAGTTWAKAHNADVVNFNPATDGGKYITLHQSFTLPQWSFNAGAYFDFAYEPLEYANAAGVRRGGIVDDLIMANVQAAIGWTDWWTMGVNMPIALYEVFYNYQNIAAPVKETMYGKMGDLRVEMKFRLLNIERYHVGLSLVPFIYMPTGKSSTFLAWHVTCSY